MTGRTASASWSRPLVGLVLLLALPLARAAGLVGRSGLDEVLLLGLYLLVMVVGSSMQVRHGRYVSRTVDVGAAAALALAVTYGLPSGNIDLSTPVVVATVALGLVGGGLIGAASVSPAVVARVVRYVLPRILTVTVISVLVRDVRGAHHALDLLQGMATGGVVRVGGPTPALVALGLTLVLLVALVLEAPVRVVFARRPDESRVAAHLQAVTESLSLGVVPASTAVLVVMAQPILGLAALPLLMLPLMFNQVAVRRHEEMREHARQSVDALSRMPEAMGLVRTGHAARVAALAADMGRELGLGRREVAELERAALLHDLGQVRLERAVPAGATVLAAPADQQDIAQAGAAIAKATGVLDTEARLIEAQFYPYRHHVSHATTIPLRSRILKVANAYDDLLTAESPGLPLDGPEAALERIYLGLGHEYDPRVVEALDKIVTLGVSGPAALIPGDVRT